jgi:hypothetical protein
MTSGAVLFWIEAMLFPISDPGLLSTFSSATTKTGTGKYKNVKKDIICLKENLEEYISESIYTSRLTDAMFGIH